MDVLSLPDTLLACVCQLLPSAAKKAARQACKAFRAAIDGAVTSLLVTDRNLRQLVATRVSPGGGGSDGGGGQQRTPSLPLLPATFPNLTHLCLATSAREHRPELLAALLRSCLPQLPALRSFDISLACRDVLLGRAHDDVLATWALVVFGLPAGRPVDLLVHMPATLRPAAVAAAPTPIEADQYPTSQQRASNGTSAPGSAVASATHADALPAAPAVPRENGGQRGSDDTPGARCTTTLLRDMLRLLRAERPLVVLHMVAAPFGGSKRYDKPRVPYSDDVAALGDYLAPGGLAALVLGPESFRPAGLERRAGAGMPPPDTATAAALAALSLATAPQALTDAADGAAGRAARHSRGSAATLKQQQQPWWLMALNGCTGRLQTLVCYEAWPLAGVAQLSGLVRLVLVDHQVVPGAGGCCQGQGGALAFFYDSSCVRAGICRSARHGSWVGGWELGHGRSPCQWWLRQVGSRRVQIVHCWLQRAELGALRLGWARLGWAALGWPGGPPARPPTHADPPTPYPSTHPCVSPTLIGRAGEGTADVIAAGAAQRPAQPHPPGGGQPAGGGSWARAARHAHTCVTRARRWAAC